MAYEFYFGNLPLPVAPSKLQLKVSGQNKTYTLIDGTEINVLKSPKLTEISFDLLIPAVQYGFAVYKNDVFQPIEYYTEVFKGLLVGKKPFQFKVNRKLPNGKVLFDTDMKVSLEDYTIKEDVKQGFDVIISVKLKQYVDYGTKTCDIKLVDDKQTATVNNSRPSGANEPTSGTSYTVVSGDNLWAISRKKYGYANNASVSGIYNANKNVIENAAKAHGLSSSENGHWIYPGTVLTIPKL